MSDCTREALHAEVDIEDCRAALVELLGEESCRQDADQQKRVEPADCESYSRELLYEHGDYGKDGE